MITLLTDATDGPDDPSHYLLDQMIATLPDGTIKTIAGDAVPYVAAYLNAQITAVAPNLVAQESAAPKRPIHKAIMWDTVGVHGSILEKMKAVKI